MGKLSIGEMAALNHVSVQTLRYYDKIGLLQPVFVDQVSGYRYYDIKQSAKLDMIQYMKSMGMSLKKIKEQWEKEDIQVIQRVLHEHNYMIEEKINELRQKKNAVEICIQNYQRYLKLPKDGRVELVRLPARKIFCFDGQKNIYEHNLATYEYILRELKKQVIIKHLPMIYFCNVGSIWRKAMIDADRFVSTEIFLFVDDEFHLGEGIEIIPENDYLCICCDSFWKEKEYAGKLFDFVKEKEYQVIGDYICEVVVEFPIFYQGERNMFIKLQVPVKSS